MPHVADERVQPAAIFANLFVYLLSRGFGIGVADALKVLDKLRLHVFLQIVGLIFQIHIGRVENHLCNLVAKLPFLVIGHSSQGTGVLLILVSQPVSNSTTR